MHNKKEWNNTRKSLLRLFFMSLVLVCIFALSVSKKSLAQETTDSATYAGSTSVKAYVTGNSENEQENQPEDEGNIYKIKAQQMRKQETRAKQQFGLRYGSSQCLYLVVE